MKTEKVCHIVAAVKGKRLPKLSEGDLVGFIGGSFDDETGATYMEFRYV